MSRYLISYDKNVDQATLENSLSSNGCTIIEKFEAISVIVVEAPTTDFSSINGVLQYETDLNITVDAHWHLNRICSMGLPVRPVYVSKNKGEGSTVYLVDSGIDTSHPELSGATIQNLWSWDNDFTDTNGHGTGLASILVGSTLGVVRNATVKSVKIPLGQTVSVSILLNAFNTILTDHLLTSGIKVVNCSWSIQKSIILDSKIAELQQNGLIVVAAAGNNVIDANTLSPVGLDTVLGVAASDVYDRVINWGTGVGSNWGPDVDITAPGINVQMAILDGSIQERSGTSIAAAVVSGVVCQYITDNPTVTSAVTIQDILIASSRKDILFRNESIYGTTPNRLVMIPYAELIASPSREDRIVNIQKGTTLTIPLVLNDPATSINIHNFTWGTKTRSAPDWISLDGTTLTISPPTTLDTSLYVLDMELLDVNSESVGYGQVSMKIYDVSVTELDTPTPLYSYFILQSPGSANEMVTIIQSVCGGPCNFTSPGTTCPAQSKSCGCVSFSGCGF